ncbi:MULTISPECIES: DUF2188 domain-containing protein [Streptococcus]|uniref:DUF2188 domain-containing protein n=1 Tax=Streptococcus TaxID=1301 RepID=UPI00128CB672|nr:DUF2188 domain-containing protein [Streptococcus dysgalactiae]
MFCFESDCRRTFFAFSYRATKHTSAQAEAIKIATEIAKNQSNELFIHRPNGQIRERNSYGNDPFPPKG